MKIKLCKEYKDLGINIEVDDIICADEEKYIYLDTEYINGYLKNDDLVNLLIKSK